MSVPTAIAVHAEIGAVIAVAKMTLSEIAITIDQFSSAVAHRIVPVMATDLMGNTAPEMVPEMPGQAP
jgi:hypothetical protein